MKNSGALHRTFNVEPLYLQHENSGNEDEIFLLMKSSQTPFSFVLKPNTQVLQLITWFVSYRQIDPSSRLISQIYSSISQHWQIPLSKRFRSLKLWFVIRSFGITGLQKHIREGVRLAQKFEALILADHRFEIPATRYLG